MTEPRGCGECTSEEAKEIQELVAELHALFFPEEGDQRTVVDENLECYPEGASIAERLRCLTDPMYVECAYGSDECED